ncbi:MAG: hypothetical protein ACRD3W_30680, partial [Terriglobales bacterium]
VYKRKKPHVVRRYPRGSIIASMQIFNGHRLILSGITSLVLLLSAAESVAAANAGTDESIYEKSSQWSIQLKATKLKQYMSYNGSQLYPLSSVNAVLLVRDPRTQQWDPPQRYEDLWFHYGSPIGCRRYQTLTKVRNELGVIRILSSADAQTETRSLISTAIRIALDVALQNGSVSVIIIPADLYEQCESDFGSLFFYEAKSGSAADTMVLLYVVSDTGNCKKYFRFRTKVADEQ